MAEHTPAPWSHRPYGGNDPVPGRIVIDGNGREICDVWNQPGTQGVVALANARLISASPTLLEACKGVLKALRTTRDTKPELWNQIVDPCLCDEWDALKAAIALAEVPS